MGAGPKKRVLQVRYTLFDYFVDIGSSFKGRLPQLILFSKAKQHYEEYCELKRHAGDKPGERKMTQIWLQKWCKEYRISLKFPKKQFAISQAEGKKISIQFFKNLYTARY